MSSSNVLTFVLDLTTRFNPHLPKGGGLSEPPKFFCSNFLMKTDIEMKFWLIVNGLTTNL